MDNPEARAVADQHVARYAARGHSELALLIEAYHVETVEVMGSRGARYQLEIECFWDDQPGGAIRIMASIDDGGVRALFPLVCCDPVSPPEPIRV